MSCAGRCASHNEIGRTAGDGVFQSTGMQGAHGPVVLGGEGSSADRQNLTCQPDHGDSMMQGINEDIGNLELSAIPDEVNEDGIDGTADTPLRSGSSAGVPSMLDDEFGTSSDGTLDWESESVVSSDNETTDDSSESFEIHRNYEADDVGNFDARRHDTGDETEVKPRTAMWYEMHKNDSLFPGCKISVMQVAFVILSLKSTAHITDKAVTALCRLLAFVILPEGNFMPHNLYMIRKICGVAPVSALTHHCCPKDHYIWPHLPKEDWLGHRNDVCPIQGCSEKRFKKPSGYDSQKVICTPSKVIYYFGLQRCISHLLSLPEWNRARASVCRDVNTTRCESIFGTELSRNMERALNVCLEDDSFGMYEVGTDWCGFFEGKSKTKTTGAFFVRAIDLTDMAKQKRSFHVPLMVVPGPREPDTVAPHVQMVVKDFMKHQPGTQGIQAKKMELHGERGVSSVRQKETTHWPVLASWVADNPARQKVAEMRGHAALRACGYCWMLGEHPGNKTVFPGYSRPVNIRPDTVPPSVWARLRAASGSSIRVHVGDERVEKTTGEMLEAGRQVSAGNWEPNYGGCNGLSPVADLLYVDYKNVWVIGVAHIILLGLLPDFMNAIFPKIARGGQIPAHGVSYENRKIVRDRHAAIHMPSGRSKPLCIVDKRGSFTMSDWWIHVK